MKKVIVVLFLLLPSLVFAEDKMGNSFYGSFTGMVSVAEDSTTELDGVDMEELEMDTGFGLAVALGKKFNNRFRGEIEYTFKKYEFADIADEDARTHTMMFNMLYDIESGSDITPYLGGGLGVGWLEEFDGSEFAYQFLAGINYAVTERADLILGYRYAGMTDADKDIDGVNLSASVDTHNFEFGVRYSF